MNICRQCQQFLDMDWEKLIIRHVCNISDFEMNRLTLKSNYICVKCVGFLEDGYPSLEEEEGDEGEEGEEGEEGDKGNEEDEEDENSKDM
jgi:hypothetical protein